MTVTCKRYDEFLEMIMSIGKGKSSDRPSGSQIFMEPMKFITSISVSADEQSLVKMNLKRFQRCWDGVYKCFPHLRNQTPPTHAFLTLHKTKAEESERVKSQKVLSC